MLGLATAMPSAVPAQSVSAYESLREQVAAVHERLSADAAEVSYAPQLVAVGHSLISRDADLSGFEVPLPEAMPAGQLQSIDLRIALAQLAALTGSNDQMPVVRAQ